MMIFYLLEMPREKSRVKKHTPVEAETPASVEGDLRLRPVTVSVQLPPSESPLKRGRKLKYQSDEERREARREQNRRYRERKKNELISLRRSAAKREKEAVTEPLGDKNNSDEQVDAIPIEL